MALGCVSSAYMLWLMSVWGCHC